MSHRAPTWTRSRGPTSRFARLPGRREREPHPRNRLVHRHRRPRPGAPSWATAPGASCSIGMPSRGATRRWNGEVVKTTGDGIMATSKHLPARLRCAYRPTRALTELGLEIRPASTPARSSGGGRIGGIGVHIARARARRAGCRAGRRHADGSRSGDRRRSAVHASRLDPACVPTSARERSRPRLPDSSQRPCLRPSSRTDFPGDRCARPAPRRRSAPRARWRRSPARHGRAPSTPMRHRHDRGRPRAAEDRHRRQAPRATSARSTWPTPPIPRPGRRRRPRPWKLSSWPISDKATIGSSSAPGRARRRAQRLRGDGGRSACTAFLLLAERGGRDVGGIGERAVGVLDEVESPPP